MIPKSFVNQVKLMEADSKNPQNSRHTRLLGNVLNLDPSGNPWPCPIPYSIDASVGDDMRETVSRALATIEGKTRWKFVNRTTESDYINVVDGNGCASYAGRVGGAQDLILSPTCLFGSVMHEFLHAIGMQHEHNRYMHVWLVCVHMPKVNSR